MVKELEIKVMNNPSHRDMPFKLQVISNNEKDAISMRLMDGTGRLIEHRQSLRSGQTVEIGSVHIQGMYYAEFVQGGQRKVVKLIKE
jgi:hypothetical protein